MTGHFVYGVMENISFEFVPGIDYTILIYEPFDICQ